jgi:hypothetical protein
MPRPGRRDVFGTDLAARQKNLYLNYVSLIKYEVRRVASCRKWFIRDRKQNKNWLVES